MLPMHVQPWHAASQPAARTTATYLLVILFFRVTTIGSIHISDTQCNQKLKMACSTTKLHCWGFELPLQLTPECRCGFHTCQLTACNSTLHVTPRKRSHAYPTLTWQLHTTLPYSYALPTNPSIGANAKPRLSPCPIPNRLPRNNLVSRCSQSYSTASYSRLAVRRCSSCSASPNATRSDLRASSRATSAP